MAKIDVDIAVKIWNINTAKNRNPRTFPQFCKTGSDMIKIISRMKSKGYLCDMHFKKDKVYAMFYDDKNVYDWMGHKESPKAVAMAALKALEGPWYNNPKLKKKRKNLKTSK